MKTVLGGGDGEWPGATSAKFTSCKKITGPIESKAPPHPLYETNGKVHYPPKLSGTQDWKSSVRINPDKDQPRTDKPQGVKMVPFQFSETHPRPERAHLI